MPAGANLAQAQVTIVFGSAGAAIEYAGAAPGFVGRLGQPTSLTFIGRVFGDAETLALAKAYQDATDWHLKHPPL